MQNRLEFSALFLAFPPGLDSFSVLLCAGPANDLRHDKPVFTTLLVSTPPHTGLDSFSALSVAAYLRALADVGHTLLVAIHQPRAAIWGMFDRVST